MNAGYLVRYAYTQGDELHLSADFNATTNVEIIGAPKSAKKLFVNGAEYPVQQNAHGFWTANVEYKAPKIELPDFSKTSWKYADSLPEIKASYDDSAWVKADHTYTNNTVYPLSTPVSLYASDYGFNTGTLVYRAHFVANGNEKDFSVETTGGEGFGSSVWLNGTFLGSWTGSAAAVSHSSTYSLPALKAGSPYTLTIVVANTGLEEDWVVGSETMKAPRGILNFDLSGREQIDLTWKLTGNLGGEDYVDLTRGPLNEGGLYAERQGWHQPYPPSNGWQTSSPLDGVSEAGVGFYTTSFKLDLPEGYDIPMYIAFGNSGNSAYRVQFYINGYQFGTFVPQLGPQTHFPVPQGILNYKGDNWIALTLWAQDSKGAKLDSFGLVNTTPIMTALTGIKSSPQPRYSERKGAY